MKVFDWFLKAHYSLILFIYKNLSLFDFIYSWKFIIVRFYLFMKFVYFLFIHKSFIFTHSHISHHLCKVHAFSHIFFEHFHDFKTHTYVQIKIKFLKIAFLSKYCKFDIWSYSFSKLNHMNFFSSKQSHFFLVFEFDHIIFFFYKRKEKDFT